LHDISAHTDDGTKLNTHL